MKTFMGGEIKEKYRGGLAAVITRPKHSLDYEIFVTSVGDSDFTDLTGTRSLSNPVERVYVGVSPKGADEVLKRREGLMHEVRMKRTRVEDIDKILVESYFLNNDPEKGEAERKELEEKISQIPHSRL